MSDTPRPPIVPFHPHVCDAGTCRLTGQLVEADGTRWDFYYCPNMTGSAIARYGPDFKYHSMPTAWVRSRPIAMEELAAQIARNQGHLR